MKIDLPEPLYAPLNADLRRLVGKYRGVYRLSEVQGMKEQVLYLVQVIFDKRLTHVILLSKRLAVLPRPAEIPAAAGGQDQARENARAWPSSSTTSVTPTWSPTSCANWASP